MRIRDLAVAAALLVSPSTAAVAQETGDQSRIIFTISGAYIGGRGLWSVPNQPVQVIGIQPEEPGGGVVGPAGRLKRLEDQILFRLPQCVVELCDFAARPSL